MNPTPPNQPKQTPEERRTMLGQAIHTPYFPRRARNTPEESARAHQKQQASRPARTAKPPPAPKAAPKEKRVPEPSELPPENFFGSLLDSPDLQAVIREWQAEGRDVKMKRHSTGWWLQVDKHHAPVEEFQKLVKEDPEVQRERLRRAVHHNITGSDMIGGKSGE